MLPNTSFRAWPNNCPCASVMNLRETIHCQGESERESRHSVGQLEIGWCEGKEIDAKKITYRVQVPAARGRVIPDIDSMSDDFPALCEPMTAIWGRSMSTCTLHWTTSKNQLDRNKGRPVTNTDPVLWSRLTKSSIVRLRWASWGLESPTPLPLPLPLDRRPRPRSGLESLEP